MKKSILAKALALTLAFNTAAAPAVIAAPPAQARPDNYAYIVIDAEDGRVLESLDATQRLYPASTTKIMTAYLVFEALKNGTLKRDTMLTVSANAASKQRTNLDLQAGTRISVEDALTGMIVHSGNDAAVVLAEAIGGSEAGFAVLMNAKARELGMTRTNFVNPNGLPNPHHTTTVEDMAKLCQALIRDYPDQYSLFSQRTFVYGGTVYTSYNRMLDTYPDLDGIKTGWTIASGSNLAASAKRGDTRIIGVVFGGRSADERNRDMARLLDNGFAKVAIAPSAHPASPLPEVTNIAPAPEVSEVPEPQEQMQPGASAPPTVVASAPPPRPPT